MVFIPNKLLLKKLQKKVLQEERNWTEYKRERCKKCSAKKVAEIGTSEQALNRQSNSDS